MKNDKWIGVDLDGTLAHHVRGSFKGGTFIGEPIPGMVAVVKQWIADGETVKIFTARADYIDSEPETIKAIEDWCLINIGQVLEITNIKDRYCEAIFDDKAFHVVMNTGITESELLFISGQYISELIKCERNVKMYLESTLPKGASDDIMRPFWDFWSTITEDDPYFKYRYHSEDIDA